MTTALAKCTTRHVQSLNHKYLVHFIAKLDDDQNTLELFV